MIGRISHRSNHSRTTVTYVDEFAFVEDSKKNSKKLIRFSKEAGRPAFSKFSGLHKRSFLADSPNFPVDKSTIHICMTYVLVAAVEEQVVDGLAREARGVGRAGLGDAALGGEVLIGHLGDGVSGVERGEVAFCRKKRLF